MEDDEHTSQPRMVRTELKTQEVATLVHANRSQTVHEITPAWISHGTCHDLNMSRVTRHSVPSVLRQDQHDDHISICSDLTDGADKDETFVNRIITGNKTWFLYDLLVQLKRQLAI